jgi:hypothetical protein
LSFPRRFCTGKVITTGFKRRIDYSVREDLAAIGVSWGVEWCVQGIDHNWAYELQLESVDDYPSSAPAMPWLLAASSGMTTPFARLSDSRPASLARA